jgi:hypothetical protein
LINNAAEQHWNSRFAAAQNSFAPSWWAAASKRALLHPEQLQSTVTGTREGRFPNCWYRSRANRGVALDELLQPVIQVGLDKDCNATQTGAMDGAIPVCYLPNRQLELLVWS